MNKIKLLFLFLTISISTLLAQDVSQKIDELVSIYNDYNQFNGTVLVSDSDEIIFEKAYGLANREWDIPNTLDTKFRLGSITKQFTAMLILQLVQDGKISLEKTIADYLPYYRKDVGEKVTVHQLLNHTSGIPSYTSDPDFFPNVSKKHYAPKEFVLEYCSNDLTFEPGSEWAYNNSGYFILGAIVEEVSGKSYEDFLHEKILKPLEMNDTGYDNHERIIKKRATGYSKSINNFTNSAWIDMSLPYAAGSMYSTVKDLVKWDRALYTEKLLSKELLTKMMTPTQRNYGYGFGIGYQKLRNGDSVKVVQHGGGINGFNTMIFRMTDSKQMITALNNTPGANLDKMCMEILHILNGLDYEEPKQSIADFLAEYIADSGTDDIESVYFELKENAANKYDFRERDLNALGYALLGENKIDEAIAIFKLNVKEYPKSSNVYDSLGEGFAKKGDKENAIINYQKSLELDPRNDNAVKELAKLGVEFETAKDAEVAKEVLETYIGTYELMPNFKIDVTLEGEQLYTQATGQPKFPVFPSSQTKFYLKVVKAEIEFNFDDAKNVKSLTLFQSGREMEAKKIQ